MEARKMSPAPIILRVIHLIKMGLLITMVLFTIFLINHFRLSNYFPIRTVYIYGANHLSQQKVQEILQPLVAKGYFSIDVDYIRERLLQMSWVADIFVRRNWPDQIVVTVVEKKPIALWNKENLLSDAGELFNPPQLTFPHDIPLFHGPAGKHITMLQYFNNFNRILNPLHAKISYLELTPFLTWKLKLDNGITLQMGHKDILTRITHFVKVYPKIVGTRAKDVEYIDLRYPNGVAIRWKETIKT